MRGLVVKGIGGFYFVKTEDGVYRAKGRGLFKKSKNTLMVGDEVELNVSKDGESDSLIEKNLSTKKPLHQTCYSKR